MFREKGGKGEGKGKSRDLVLAPPPPQRPREIRPPSPLPARNSYPTTHSTDIPRNPHRVTHPPTLNTQEPYPEPPMVQNARKLAEEKHAKDPVQLALIARAFDFFISASRERFENMVQNNPTSADAHFQIGNFYHTIQMYTRAETSYRDCLRLDANHADALNNLAMLLGQLDRDDEVRVRGCGWWRGWGLGLGLGLGLLGGGVCGGG